MLGTGTARAVQHVWAPQARVVHAPARGQQGQAEEGYEEGEEEDDDERGRDVGVALTRDSVDDEVEFDDGDVVEDQAAEEAAAKAARDQRGNRRLGRAHFTPEEIQSIQSFLPPPGLTPEAAEAPSDSSPPSLPAPSAPVAPAPVAAPIVPSSGSPSASAGPRDFLAAPHSRVPPANHEFGFDPYGDEFRRAFRRHVDRIRELKPVTPGAQVSEPVPYHPDTGRAALSDDEVPQVPRSVGRSGFGLPRFHTSGNLFGPDARSGRTDRGRPSSLPDVDTSEEEDTGSKGKKGVREKIRGFLPSMGRKEGKGKKREGEDDEDGGGGLV
ncbi:hypothetical protein B0H65DRAFT_452267 [Neurospora tetraspora]|uniref:Uncharacterized protein n=1 Tax=Neurospora tetraspora TaxID=94610 RepID=A0AAE0JQB5_9PEZI|nr:hypothetical protein B0H65DRAFT_452267 [Neurospora tetraspora]